MRRPRMRRRGRRGSRTNSLALTALGDVRLRQGDPRGAFVQFQKAVQADLCNARAYYGGSEVDGLAGIFASSKRLIERAYALRPTDDDINVAWIETRQRSERLAKLAEYAEHSDQISEENRTKMKTSLARPPRRILRTAGWRRPRRERRRRRWWR